MMYPRHHYSNPAIKRHSSNEERRPDKRAIRPEHLTPCSILYFLAGVILGVCGTFVLIAELNIEAAILIHESVIRIFE